MVTPALCRPSHIPMQAMTSSRPNQPPRNQPVVTSPVVIRAYFIGSLARCQLDERERRVEAVGVLNDLSDVNRAISVAGRLVAEKFEKVEAALTELAGRC